MGIITDMMNKGQTCVWWARTGADRYGKDVYAAPVQKVCRWQDGTEEFMDPEGERRVSTAKVFVPVDMQPGDVLYEGTLVGAPTLTVPNAAAGLHKIAAFKKVPDFDNNEVLRVAML